MPFIASNHFRYNRYLFDFTLATDYTMKRPANICGNALLNITPSFDYGHPLKDHRLARISSAWAHASAIPVKRSSRQQFKVELAALCNSNDGPHNDLHVANRCVLLLTSITSFCHFSANMRISFECLPYFVTQHVLREKQRNVQRTDSDRSSAVEAKPTTVAAAANIDDNVSVTPSSSSVQTMLPSVQTSEKSFPPSVSRCSNKSISSSEEAGHFSKMGSFKACERYVRIILAKFHMIRSTNDGRSFLFSYFPRPDWISMYHRHPHHHHHRPNTENRRMRRRLLSTKLPITHSERRRYVRRLARKVVAQRQRLAKRI